MPPTKIKSVTKLIAFTTPQAAWAIKRAADLGITFTELIRRLVDKERGV